MHSEQISVITMPRGLQNIQDCQNMMKSGHQKDILECSTQTLSDPIKGAKKDDDKMDEELAKHIDECLFMAVSG